LSQPSDSATVSATREAANFRQEADPPFEIRREAAMSFFKSAALFVVATVLVIGTLIGVHALVHVVRFERTARNVSGFSYLPPSPGRPLDARRVRWNTRPRPIAMRTAQAFRGGANDGRLAGVLQAGADRPVDRRPAAAPNPLPAPTHAVPLPSAADDWPSPNDVPKADSSTSGPPPSRPRPPSASGRRLIEKELPNSSTEERDLWHDTTKDLPLNDLRELLRLRAQIGRLSPPWTDAHRSPNQQGAPLPSSPLMGTGPIYSAPLDGSGPAAAELDPGRVLSESMTAIAQARQVLLNNIANAQTNGYKRRLISFESAADRPMASSLPENPFQIRLGLPVETGARLSPVVCDMAAGKVAATNRSLDLAIEGQGFFHLVDGRNKRDVYTRRGRFTLNKRGRLTLLANGGEWFVEPPLTIPTAIQTVEISTDGQVRGRDPEKNALIACGSLQTACFPAAMTLTPADGTLFIPPDGASPEVKSPGVSGHGLIRQGALEESNVDVKHELEALARLNAQLQTLEQATRLMQPAGIDRSAPPPDSAGSAGSLP
jgi:flagellar basal-body rod protein FlgG